MRSRNFLFILLLLCCGSDTSFARHRVHAHRSSHVAMRSSVAPIYGPEQLAYQIGYLINSSNERADIAVYVKSMRTGTPLYAFNINQPLVPASTLKILTAEAALIFLGSDYRFSTQLLTDAKSVKNGVLQGNLYVVLSGDPTLTSYDLMGLLEALKNEQIQAISGNVYIDNTAYDQSFYGPGWIGQDKRYCYAAPISASIINHNCLTNVAPKWRNFSQKKRQRARNYRLRISRDSNGIISIDSGRSNGRYTLGVSSVVTDVPEYNRALFKSMLNQLGVTVYGSVTFGSAPTALSLIDSHNSKPLRAMITDMLKKSDNVIAGALFKKLGQLYSNQPGSWQNGSLAVSQILSKRAGVNIAGMRILDGSGLSPDNLATPAQMMQVLNFAYHHQGSHDDFIGALPIAGVDGTLKHRMGNITRKVRAKTGTISGVISLAGYADSRDKEALAFVIMINGRKGFSWRYKSLEDKIATALTRFKR